METTKQKPKLKEAFKRLSFTISKGNKPNKADIEAYNEISKFFKMAEEKTIQDNLLFAKLYTLVLSDFLMYYTDIDFANKEINRVLAEPMELRINILQQRLKLMELQNYFNRKNILDPFLKTKNASELEEIHNRYIDKLPQLDSNEFLKCCNNWDIESVKYQLENNINLSLQNFKNYV